MEERREIPDIVPERYWLSSDDLQGWSPPIADVDPEDPDRVWNGLVTPKEMALQLSYGIQQHSLDMNEHVSWPHLFARARSEAIAGIKNNGMHEYAYISSIALWHERENVIDYPNGYQSFSSLYDGYTRTLMFSNPDSLVRELSNSLDKFIGYVKLDCRSRQEVRDMDDREFAEQTVALGLDGIIEGMKMLKRGDCDDYDLALDAEITLRDYQETIERDDKRLGRRHQETLTERVVDLFCERISVPDQPIC